MTPQLKAALHAMNEAAYSALRAAKDNDDLRPALLAIAGMTDRLVDEVAA